MIFQKDITSSNVWNELISLFVGSCCVFRARLIRSADGEDGPDFDEAYMLVDSETCCTPEPEWLVRATG